MIAKVKNGKYKGMKGEIIGRANNLEQSVAIEFETEIEGLHDCCKTGKKDRCFYFNPRDLIVLDND